jgi:thioredoxin 1
MKQLFIFTSDWCSSCKTLEPIIEQVSQKIQIQKINIDYTPDVTLKYGVRSIPTVLLVENEKELRRFVGVKSLQQILDFIQ